ncbi:MAG TPA: beta-L-arabinofuranosidase domain-containing protein, partial [Puia sp.]|nr:beta-L-arabinofuranosidase domain-containing protein [Puia sp.]
MKKILLLAAGISGLTAFAQQDYPVHAVPFTVVQLQDHFWLPRIETNRLVTIPASFEQCRVTGRIRNFEMAAARSGKFCTVYPFDDTDIYKTIEGASYSLATHPDKQLEAYLDTLIGLIARAQEPDGYLYTARTIDPLHAGAWAGKERWEKEGEMSHELYNAGHLYEAATAHFLATGKRNLLDIAIKNADLVCSVFGPGKRQVAPGHEIVEMGLVKMYRVTGNLQYLNTARFFLDERGHTVAYDRKSRDPWKNGSYWQNDQPVTRQQEVEGHAVRAMYLCSAMTDIAALTGDTAYLHAVDRLWANMVGKKIYLHGGIGSIGDGERFGDNYDLPNATAYAETCAAIGAVFWDYRMFLLHGDAKYIDVLERTLYNGLLSGIGLDGKSFFYTNAMQVSDHLSHPDLERSRSGWFTCSCCPTNLVRLLPSIPGYVYAYRGDRVFVNLYISSHAKISLSQKNSISFSQESNYPWQGDVRMTVDPVAPADFSLMLRIPGWARNEAIPGNLYCFLDSTVTLPVIKVNGREVSFDMEKGYAVVKRKWKKGDQVELA